MAYETLFLRNLTVVPGGNSCSIKILPLMAAYKAFDIAECDENGDIIEGAEIKRVDCKMVEHQNSCIIIERNKERDVFYRIMPVIVDGMQEIRLQETGNTGNIVKISMVQIIVTYHFIPAQEGKKKLFGKAEDTPATLEITVGMNATIGSGELGYVVDGMIYPLPKLQGCMKFTMSSETQNLSLIVVKSNDRRFDIRITG